MTTIDDAAKAIMRICSSQGGLLEEQVKDILEYVFEEGRQLGNEERQRIIDELIRNEGYD